MGVFCSHSPAPVISIESYDCFAVKVKTSLVDTPPAVVPAMFTDARMHQTVELPLVNEIPGFAADGYAALVASPE